MVKIYLRKSSRLQAAIISLDPPPGDKKDIDIQKAGKKGFYKRKTH